MPRILSAVVAVGAAGALAVSAVPASATTAAQAPAAAKPIVLDSKTVAPYGKSGPKLAVSWEKVGKGKFRLCWNAKPGKIRNFAVKAKETNIWSGEESFTSTRAKGCVSLDPTPADQPSGVSTQFTGKRGKTTINRWIYADVDTSKTSK